jgi:hypothetical protein
MNSATIKDAPAFLNLNDKAMWVLGYNACLEKAAEMGQIRDPQAPLWLQSQDHVELSAHLHKLGWNNSCDAQSEYLRDHLWKPLREFARGLWIDYSFYRLTAAQRDKAQKELLARDQTDQNRESLIRDFEHWLNDHRNSDVASVFHDTVGKVKQIAK